MASIIILLGVIAVFTGFIFVMLIGIFSMLHDIKSFFKKEATPENKKL